MTAATVIYQCPECEERMRQRRCEDCNLFTRRLGAGAPCPHCDELVALTDLITTDQLATTPKPAR